jgi:hypothetical protein
VRELKISLVFEAVETETWGAIITVDIAGLTERRGFYGVLAMIDVNFMSDTGLRKWN